MISWAWTVFPVSIYDAHNTTVTIKTMSSSCIQTVKIYYQLCLDILISSVACKKKNYHENFLLKKNIRFPARRSILGKVHFYSFCCCFCWKTGHLKSLAKSSAQTKLRALARWGKKNPNFWFQPQTTSNRGWFLINSQKFLLLFFCFSAKTAKQYFLANSSTNNLSAAFDNFLGIMLLYSKFFPFSFLYLNASVGTEASLNDDICSSLIQNMI